MKSLDASWREWIQTNIERGSNKEEMYQILMKEGFDPSEVSNTMKHTPQCNNPNCPVHHPKQPKGKTLADTYALKALDNAHFPNAKRVETDKINLNIIEDFLDEKTCTHLMNIIKKNHYESTITTVDTEPDKYFRTSKTADMPQSDPVVKALESQICNYLGIEMERSETTQGQYYEIGNEFKPHTDWFTRNSDEWEKFAAVQGQRTWTFMLYLNDVEEGGETEYTDLHIAMKPKRGMGIFWNNMDSNGNELQDTIHWGKPPIKGKKFVITKWFREYGSLSTPFQPRIANMLTNYTKLGFIKQTLPDDLFKALTSFYTKNKHLQKQEIYDEGLKNFLYTSKGLTDTCPAKILTLEDAMVERLKTDLLDRLECWSGQALEWTSIYGIRNYQRDAVLKMHTDVYKTHVISFIINVHQDVEEDWPLVFRDNYGRMHDIIIKPGEIVLYESARCYHGRPHPFKGDNFANIFGHTRPVGFESTAQTFDELVEKKLVRVQ